MSAKPFLSVIIPARDEASNLPQLVQEVHIALTALSERSNNYGEVSLTDFEIIIIDDGSVDETWSVLHRLVSKYQELRCIRFNRAAGQSAATAAGFQLAQGNWIATLDGDLQNDPADLMTLWSALPGYDAALGWRSVRADSWSKRITSQLANWIRNLVLRQSIRDTGCSVRIFPRWRALCLPLFDGVHRFWGPLLVREGCRVVQVPVRHRQRIHGHSHYNFWNRSLSVLIDLFGVIWLMHRPLRYHVRSTRYLQSNENRYFETFRR